MLPSLVDYVLQRGNKDYGEFAPRKQIDQNAALFNHRKMLEFLFADKLQDNRDELMNGQKRISDMKAEEITGQLNYFSEKIHAELSRKYLNLDSDLYRLQSQWLKKNIPTFYCYYFLKFAYANSYSRLHELILSEIQNMTRQKDSYWVIRKTIEAREVCLMNLRKEITQLTELDVGQSLQTIRQDQEMKNKIMRQHGNQLKGYTNKSTNKIQEQTGKSWKNKLQLVFQSVQHLRKLTCYVVQLIKNWKTTIYNISDDPRRYRQRVIFYHHEANYLLKMLWDANFIKESPLNKYIHFATHFDPFMIKPLMVLQAKKKKTQVDDIFLDLLKPNDQDMGKIVRSLIVLAEEEYDEDQQSRFISEKKNYGELQHRKKVIEKKREGLGLGQRQQSQSEKKLPVYGALIKGSEEESPSKKLALFTNDKKSSNLPSEIQSIKAEKIQLQSKPTLKPGQIQTSLNRIQRIRSIDLKKISPYLSRNQLLKKAQQVVQFQHKFRVAHNQYLQNVKKPNKSVPHMDPKSKAKMNEFIQANKEITSNRIFNKYIEENVRMLDEANKRSFLYKNKLTPQRNSVQEKLGYNKVSFHDRKQTEYQINLHKYFPKQSASQQKFYPAHGATGNQNTSSPTKKTLGTLKTADQQRKGTKAIIEISDRGIKAGQQIIDFQLSGKKGKNLGSILQNQDKANLSNTVKQKLTDHQPSQDPSLITIQPQTASNKATNLFTSQAPQQIIVLRQEPQKLQQLKKSLYEQIKQQLLEELKNAEIKKEDDLNSMIEDEKRRKLQEIIEQRRLEEERRKEEEERMRVAQLDKERKKINIPVKVQNIQYAQQNLDEWWFTKVSSFHLTLYTKLFTLQSLESTRTHTQSRLHTVFLKGFHQGQQSAYCILTYAHQHEATRKFVINYLCVKQTYHYISTFHNICEYMWRNDPVEELELVMYENLQDEEGGKVIEDVKEYAQRNGQMLEKQLYSNVKQLRITIYRPKQLRVKDMGFPYQGFYFSKVLNFKSELLSASISLSQRKQPEIDMNLQTFTNYVFLLQELFRSYLTPQEIVQLRQNSVNIRRLKDIFRIVLQLQKGKPLVQELTVVEGLNLDDLYAKVKDKLKPPYDKYYWNTFYDKTKENRILLSILQTKLDLTYPINTAMINDKRMYRINVKNKLLVLKSSVYSKQDIYILPTNNPKIRLFFTNGQNYKLMRIELFIFLNLVFNNIVEDNQKYINCMWVPQFCITLSKQQSEKKVKRITDFSISMKKSFFLSEEIYFCNHEYIRNGFAPLPKTTDVIFRESIIFGMLHTDVEKSSTGMPIYAKLIDRNQYF